MSDESAPCYYLLKEQADLPYHYQQGSLLFSVTA
jgi:hypothetical protein